MAETLKRWIPLGQLMRQAAEKSGRAQMSQPAQQRPDLLRAIQQAQEAISGSVARFGGLAGDALARRTGYRDGDATESAGRLAEALRNPIPFGTMAELDQAAQMRMAPGSLRPNLTEEEIVSEGLNVVGMAPVGMVAKARPLNALGQEIPPTRYELAHQEAQRNAALPREQGGLGLPPDNTAMDRARAMGFKYKMFHGTAADINKFDEGFAGQNMKQPDRAIFTTNDPNIANIYAEWADPANKRGYGGDESDLVGQVIYPVVVGGKNITTSRLPNSIESNSEAIEYARRKGYDGVNFTKDSFSDPGKTIATIDGKNIRSRFAAFDPMRRDSADLLASASPFVAPMAAGTIGAAALMGADEADAGEWPRQMYQQLSGTEDGRMQLAGLQFSAPDYDSLTDAQKREWASIAQMYNFGR